MKLKNVFSLLAALVVLCVGAMAVAAPAPSQLGQSRAAIEVAKAEIPANCNLIGYTTKGDESRITFQDPDTLEYYYVKVATATSKIKEIEVKGATFVKGSTIINKTPADIERFVMAEYLDARNIVVTMDKEGNNSYYEAEFTTLKFKGELKFNPATGVIFERELDYY